MRGLFLRELWEKVGVFLLRIVGHGDLDDIRPRIPNLAPGYLVHNLKHFLVEIDARLQFHAPVLPQNTATVYRNTAMG